MAKEIKNEYQLLGYLQAAVRTFVKSKGEFEPDNEKGGLKHRGTYTLKMLDIVPTIKFEGRFVVAVLVDVYDNFSDSITLVTDSTISSYVGGFPRGIGCRRDVFESYDTRVQIMLAQQIIGALALNDIINEL